jgi:ribosomal protein S18 acetylase RimI-like enzyme
MVQFAIPGYVIQQGSGLDRALLVRFMQRTYQELYPDADFNHLARTVDHYFSSDTPLWWVLPQGGNEIHTNQQTSDSDRKSPLVSAEISDRTIELPETQRSVDEPHWRSPIACLWIGNAIEQSTGDRHAHVFLLYVAPQHRRQGIGSALMQHAERWAKLRGDRQVGLQVFHSNQEALSLYTKLGYEPQSVWMVKQI